MMTRVDNKNICQICGKKMREFKGVFLCLPCNDKFGEYYNFFSSASKEIRNTSDTLTIECPGVSIYSKDNSSVVQGIKWNNNRDFSQGYEIIGKQMFAPAHKKIRIIPQDKADNICRCQACQDFTVRMRIYNQQKGKSEYTQNSPMMPKDEKNFKRPSL